MSELYAFFYFYPFNLPMSPNLEMVFLFNLSGLHIQVLIFFLFSFLCEKEKYKFPFYISVLCCLSFFSNIFFILLSLLQPSGDESS